ncbi:DUF2164 domain-containing protein [Roseimicrobium sp. ORNL1]|uniref:DUF2164 domain-containing protein n=1 Tax=Roseimicrobium sp. ORNL1 TaxID=2711231 RepID=UPI0013E138ED|nr:DUF2164 domain-containing protein [Roseimicrobium sp. ORNL1]QIF03675.1 DUF2164 domain-containing protein [Roseimicrobium sp. ORNL1]
MSSSPLLTKEQKQEAVESLKRFFTETLDAELSDLQAGFFLDYIMSEMAPIAYNQGVEDARRFIAAQADELPGTCFQEAMTYWQTQKGASRGVRRKPGG